MIRRHLVLGVLCWTLAFAVGFAGTPGAGEGAKPKTKPSPGTAKTKLAKTFRVNNFFDFLKLREVVPSANSTK